MPKYWLQINNLVKWAKVGDDSLYMVLRNVTTKQPIVAMSYNYCICECTSCFTALKISVVVYSYADKISSNAFTCNFKDARLWYFRISPDTGGLKTTQWIDGKIYYGADFYAGGMGWLYLVCCWLSISHSIAAATMV